MKNIKFMYIVAIVLLAGRCFGYSSITQTAGEVPLDLPRLVFYEQVNDAVYALTATDVPAVISALNAALTDATVVFATGPSVAAPASNEVEIAASATGTEKLSVDIKTDALCAAGDDLLLTFEGSSDLTNSAGAPTQDITYAQLNVDMTDETATTEDGTAAFGVIKAGSMTTVWVADATGFEVTGVADATSYAVGGVAGWSGSITNASPLSTNVTVYVFGIVTGNTADP